MIDIEIDVFDAVYPYLSELVPEGSFVSEYVPSPATLPHVSLMEIGNDVDPKTRDSGHNEYSAIVDFEANVYATSKSECRAIVAKLDEAMVDLMGFSRLMGQQIPNRDDVRIYRYVARYRGGVTITKDLYRP